MIASNDRAPFPWIVCLNGSVQKQNMKAKTDELKVSLLDFTKPGDKVFTRHVFQQWIFQVQSLISDNVLQKQMAFDSSIIN